MKYFLAYMCHIYVVLDTTLSIGDWTCMYDHYILTCMNSFIVLPKKTIGYPTYINQSGLTKTISHINSIETGGTEVLYHIPSEQNGSQYPTNIRETGETEVVCGITRLDYNQHTKDFFMKLEKLEWYIVSPDLTTTKIPIIQLKLEKLKTCGII